VGIAMNRGGSVVREEDLYAARRRYSSFALRSLAYEDDPRRGKLETILRQFARRSSELSLSDVKSSIVAGGSAHDDVEFYINLLCDLGFLGIEENDSYTFPSSEW